MNNCVYIGEMVTGWLWFESVQLLRQALYVLCEQKTVHSDGCNLSDVWRDSVSKEMSFYFATLKSGIYKWDL
jgi:hypothetical protein